MFPPLDRGLSKRCSKADRLQRIRETGGTPACEEAVVKGLHWLKTNQSGDGSWGKSNKVAMTGLALLSYFGHCENPTSEEFGESCLKGIVYLVDVGMRNDGKMATEFSTKHWPYEHAIATYALAEAAIFCKSLKISIPSLMDVTEKAGNIIIDNQNTNGGWAYLYAKSGGHTDVSVTGWQIQALKACSHIGVKFKGMNSCVRKGLDYLETCQNENGGYGYTGTNPSGNISYFSLSGVGMLCYQMWDKGDDADVRKATKYVLVNTRLDYNSSRCDLYAHYYESQAMMQSGGEAWKTYNSLFRDQILNNQDSDGSWRIPGGGQKIEAVAPLWAASTQEGKIYRTSLCILMLEVYYRFLNTGGGSQSHVGI
ncbi:MAG: terpene cyclase/mutase family protein [Gloeobacteraceae cyanobacterium ES-bin-144]|nr:terpene cyclase/mutase family protein [Verrucomicrobiales bacterium]